MYTWPLWVLAALLFAAGGVCLFDVWLYVTGRPSISRRTIDWLYRNPGPGFLAVAAISGLLFWIIGVLTGHLVWGLTVTP